MRTMKTLIFLLCSLSYPLFGQQILSNWETARKSETVELQNRWVLIGDTLKTRELLIKFDVNASPMAIIKNLKNENNFQKWSESIEYCKNIKQTSNSWIMYSLFNIPRPFTQRDLIAKYSVEQFEDKTTIKVKALPQYLPPKKRIKRMNNYSGHWVLKDLGHNNTQVKFYSTSFTKPVFPRFIQDPILQQVLIKSFENLIKLSENEIIAQN